MKTKFKIYKIKSEYKSVEKLLKKIKNSLNKKDIKSELINKEKFKGFIFENESKPNWYDCISDLRGEKNNKIFVNLFASYILVYKTNKGNIYAISGGQGYTFLRDYIELNFGLNLVPKLIKNNDLVVKRVVEERLSGNTISDTRINRHNTSLNFESDFLNIYKELIIDVSPEILSELLNLNEEQLDNLDSTKIINKNYLSIEKTFSIQEIPDIFNKLDEIQEKDVYFPLNPFKSLQKTNYSQTEVNKLMYDLIKKNKTDDYSFKIVGENLEEYYANDYFKIDCIDLESQSPITWEIFFNRLKNKNRITIKLLKEAFKYSLCAYDSNNLKSLDLPLFYCLSGQIIDEKNGEIFYLMNGKWYVLEESYENIISEKFSKIYEHSEEYVNLLNKSYPIFKEIYKNLEKYEEKITEDRYNDKFKNVPNVIYAHKTLIKNIEIADLIIYDKHNDCLCLFCLKYEFSGSGVRDLYGQIESSSNIIQNLFINSRESFLDDYYDKLVNNNETKLPFSKKDFKNFILNGKICFIAGFLNDFKKETLSYYIKILSYTTCKKLYEKNFNFYLMDFIFK